MPDLRLIDRTLHAIHASLRPGGRLLGIVPSIDAIAYHAMLLVDRALERGLNPKEAMEVAAVLNIPIGSDPEAGIADEAAAIREAVGVGCVVIHPRRAAAAATADGTAHFAGPFVQHPQIRTGAGDHFNAGFCLGRTLGLDLTESLCAGVSTSGYYVRSAQSPTLAALAEFIAELPPPEG